MPERISGETSAGGVSFPGISQPSRRVLLYVLRSFQLAFHSILRWTGLYLTSKFGLFRGTSFLALIALATVLTAQPPQKWSADSVLALMDSSARDFHTLSSTSQPSNY